MKVPLTALIAGMLFGAGLALSGMADPARVQAFLDLGGAWDPTLAFVMGGATVPMALAWMVRRTRARPMLADRFAVPDSGAPIDRRLIAGALLFGVGWGIGGLCPGPAIADLAIAPLAVAPFVLAMLAGMAGHRWLTA